MNTLQRAGNHVDLVLFQKRLAETIAWCSLQKLESAPPETEEFRRRKQLEREGAALYRRGHLLDKKHSLQSWLLSYLPLSKQGDAKDLQRQGLELMRAGDVTPILPLNNQLRTAALRRQPFVYPQASRGVIVEELSEKRAALLRERNAYPQNVSFDLAGGKLLVYEPDDNVEDGASQHQTKGYFDGCDAPPWDTWVRYFQCGLISWVPPQLLSLANDGIEVNCVDCIRWIDETLLKQLVGSADLIRQ